MWHLESHLGRVKTECEDDNKNGEWKSCEDDNKND